MVYLQVKLCDPCLSALRLCMRSKWRYINTLRFVFLSVHSTEGTVGRDALLVELLTLTAKEWTGVLAWVVDGTGVLAWVVEWTGVLAWVVDVGGRGSMTVLSAGGGQCGRKRCLTVDYLNVVRCLVLMPDSRLSRRCEVPRTDA